MDKEDMINFIAQEWVDKIKALQLPGLVFHADHNQYLETLIRMQLSELYFATSYQCNTERVGERLVQLLSQRVRDAIALPTCNPAAVEFLRDIPDNGVCPALTWITLPCQLQKMKQESPFLTAKLRTPPPQGGFVTLNRLMEIWCEIGYVGELCDNKSSRSKVAASDYQFEQRKQ
jgi:hypothetical protein